MPEPFADRLLAADPAHPTARQRYDLKVRAMLDNSLTRRQRVARLLGAALAATAAVGWFGLSLTLFDGDGNSGVSFLRVCLALMAVAAVGVAGTLLRSGWVGTARWGAGGWATGVGIGYLALVGGVLLFVAGHLPDELRSDTQVSGGLLVAYAAVAWVRSHIARSEQATAERLLELELRLAEMQEAMRSVDISAA